MSKLALFMMVSLDGYYEGSNHDLSWHNVDQEFNQFASLQLDEFDGLVFGRRTYEMMAGFWPTEQAKTNDPVVSAKMNSMSKVVVSKTLKTPSWDNTVIINDDLATNINNLKAKSSQGLLVLGSSNLMSSLIDQRLIDELRIMVNPVLLGDGSKLFAGLKVPTKLQLVSERKFQSGNMLLSYMLVN